MPCLWYQGPPRKGLRDPKDQLAQAERPQAPATTVDGAARIHEQLQQHLTDRGIAWAAKTLPPANQAGRPERKGLAGGVVIRLARDVRVYSTVTMSTAAATDYDLRNSWLLDSAADSNICNDLGCFAEYERYYEPVNMLTGNASSSALERMIAIVNAQRHD